MRCRLARTLVDHGRRTSRRSLRFRFANKSLDVANRPDVGSSTAEPQHRDKRRTCCRGNGNAPISLELLTANSSLFKPPIELRILRRTHSPTVTIPRPLWARVVRLMCQRRADCGVPISSAPTKRAKVLSMSPTGTNHSSCGGSLLDLAACVSTACDLERVGQSQW